MRIMHISRASIMVRQFLIPLIEAQKKRGHYVCVCGSDDSDARKLKDIGIDVFTHKMKRSLSPLGVIKTVTCIKRMLVDQKVDVVICHSPLGAGVGRIAARLAKTPNIIYFVHGFPCAPGQNILLWFVWFYIEKMLGRVTDAILVMNDYDEKLSRKRRMLKDVDKIFRVPGMGVDVRKFTPDGAEEERQQLRQELGIPDGTKIVLSVAYLIPEKGVFVYQAAANTICNDRDDVCFLLAGSGPSMGDLNRVVQLSRQADNFRLLGWRDDIPRLMQAADIFVLPTYYFEGLPVSILEAMACSKPVVATRHRGCEDAVVDGQTGFLVPPKEVGPLVDKISSLLDDEQLRTQMGRAGRNRVEERFELKHCTEVILETLENTFQTGP